MQSSKAEHIIEEFRALPPEEQLEVAELIDRMT